MLTVRETKKFFFDRKVVIDAVGRASATALARGGALVRTIARRSMRRRKKSSPAGSPPSVHVGTMKDLLFFAYDPATTTTVVGPAKFGGKAEAPNLNEFGGHAQRKRRDGSEYTARYPKRAFMFPALEKATPSLPAMWANSVKGE